jgi:hypothetical protein
MPASSKPTKICSKPGGKHTFGMASLFISA